ncbi:MAG TPA: 30S ribosomal protein S5 [Anaerolineae bacterium]|jgi:small subunit ribosomal protein S5
MERTERTDRRRRDTRQGNRPRDDKQEELDQRVVDVTRVAKVIKGGRRFAFRALIVVGNNNGKVGIGIGKARGVQDAIRKATERARSNMKDVNIVSGTIPHEILTKHGGAKVLLKPASPGTGIKAGGGVRAVLEAVGVRDILTKSLGSSSKMNATYATFKGLMDLKNIDEEAKRRNKPVSEVQPFWRRGNDSTSNSK